MDEEVPDDVKDWSHIRSHTESIPSIWIDEYLTPHTKISHGVIEILISKKTMYQDMAIVDIGSYGRALILDGRMQTASKDEFLYHEPLIHMPCIYHGHPKSVLVLGGADGGAAREFLRWNCVESVTMVDIDGEVVDACREHLSSIHQGCFSDSRMNVTIGDALEFLKNGSSSFDVISGDLTDPLETGPSYELFTKEFFELVKSNLTANTGIFVIQSGSISLIEEPHLFARINSTLKSVFTYVKPFASFIPTYGTPLGFCLASDNPALSQEFSAKFVDELLSEKTRGEFRALDGILFHGLLGIPRCVRLAIDQETVVYSSKSVTKA
mmetsp:Transcript_7437/g.13428  ORF Transcript_7437/g.13428 Transcript_7437/m.13428 type:complete len:325 (-) Transcript_7437:2105-3079(-)